MATLTVNKQASLAGKSYTRNLSVVGAGLEQADPTVPASKSGTMSVKLDADTGKILMDAATSIQVGDVLHFYWLDPSDGSTVKCHRAIVDTVVGRLIGFGYAPGTGSDTTGHGDAIPDVATVVQAMTAEPIVFSAVGSQAIGILAAMPRPGYIVFVDGSNVELLAIDLRVYNGYVWTEDDGANPLSGTVAKVLFSHNYTAGTVSASAAILRES